MSLSSCSSLVLVHVVIIQSVVFDPSVSTSRYGPVHTLTRLHASLRSEPVHKKEAGLIEKGQTISTRPANRVDSMSGKDKQYTHRVNDF